MKKIFAPLLFSALCAAPALAQPLEQFVVRHQVLQLSDAAMKELRGQSRISPEVIKSSQAKVIQTTEMLVLSDHPSLVHIGRKFPITYFDPRANQFQIQYVDTGCKLDFKGHLNEQGEVSYDCNPEISVLRGLKHGSTPQGVTTQGERTAKSDGAIYPQTEVMRTQTITQARLGESLIVGRFSGLAAHHFLDGGSGAAAPNNFGDNLAVVITVDRLQK